MGCCDKVKKAVSIIEGNLLAANEFLRMAFELPVDQYKYAHDRIAACEACPHSTWISVVSYIMWIKMNLKDVLVNLDRLEDLPPLPIRKEPASNKKLVCSVCKCWVKKKAYLETETCPTGNPVWNNREILSN